MEAQEAILTRRSIRKYQDRPISDDDLHEILECALYAPSCSNMQPWHFVVVRSPEAKRKVDELMGVVASSVEPDLAKAFEGHPEVVQETCSFIRQLGGAPVYVLVFWQKEDFNGKDPKVLSLSIGAAIENMLVAARAKGIGSCWLTAPLDAGVGEKLRAEFAPDNGQFCSLVTLGYPTVDPKAPRRKLNRSEFV
jgi:nitroreductase